MKLAHAPIVEAVLNIDCDMPPDFKLSAVEPMARDAYGDDYSKVQKRQFREHRVEQKDDTGPELSIRDGLQAFLFLKADQKQIVQVRSQGFSFNRLAPYSSLDDYLPEMERTWSIFSNIAEPVRVRRVKLRYINRILLPLVNGEVELDKYLKLRPRVPEEDNLKLINFMDRNVAVDQRTNYKVTTVLASQERERDRLPVIFDIEVSDNCSIDPSNWNEIKERVGSLRLLKNSVFEHTLKKACLEIFK